MIINEATREYVLRHRDDDVRKLALQGSQPSGVNMTQALEQIAGWQTARRKLPLWATTEGIVYPPHLNMEQCSSEQTARYKASLLVTPSSTVSEGGCFVDLTGGFGVDFYWMSQGFAERVYVEQNAALCAMAEHNFKLLGHDCSVVCNTAAACLEQLSHANVIYLDPSRRNEHGGRTYDIRDCSPDVVKLLPLLMEKADKTVLKLSPMLDWHKALEQLKFVREVHIVSVGNECKELLLILSKKVTGGLRLVCVNDGQRYEPETIGQNSAPDGGHTELPPSETVGEYGKNGFLYEPNASIMKAGCFGALARDFHIKPLASNSHLFLSSVGIDDFPGRRFQVLAISSANQKEFKKKFSESLEKVNQKLTSMESANIAVRNFPLTVDQLRKKLKLKDGGDFYIFATTLSDGQHKLFICRKIG